jgi:hypothetical protein
LLPILLNFCLRFDLLVDFASIRWNQMNLHGALCYTGVLIHAHWCSDGSRDWALHDAYMFI